MIVQHLGALVSASRGGQYVRNAWQDNSQAFQPIREVVWDSKFGKKVVRPFSTVAWNAFCGSVDGLAIGTMWGVSWSLSLVAIEALYGKDPEAPSAFGLGMVAYQVMKLGKASQRFGHSLGTMYGVYEAIIQQQAIIEEEEALDGF